MSFQCSHRWAVITHLLHFRFTCVYPRLVKSKWTNSLVLKREARGDTIVACEPIRIHLRYVSATDVEQIVLHVLCVVVRANATQRPRHIVDADPTIEMRRCHYIHTRRFRDVVPGRRLTVESRDTSQKGKGCDVSRRGCAEHRIRLKANHPFTPHGLPKVHIRHQLLIPKGRTVHRLHQCIGCRWSTQELQTKSRLCTS